VAETPPRFTGVVRTPHGHYVASVLVRGKRVYLGTWATPRKAAIARDRASLFFRLAAPLGLPGTSRKLGACAPRDLIWSARKQRKISSGKSQFFGVAWDPAQRRWAALVSIDGHQRRIATFDREDHAAVARDRVLLRTFGRRALLNFPSRRLRPASIDEIRKDIRRDRKRTATSRYLGVHRNLPSVRRNRESWGAHLVTRDGNGPRVLNLGVWPTERKAAVARDRAVLHYVRAGSRDVMLNFPTLSRKLTPADAISLRQEAHRQYKATTTSRYRGVCRASPDSARWVSRIWVDGKDHFLGVFETEEAAARAYDKAALRLRGTAAALNFRRGERTR
jgi:hypothetical protein